MNYSRVKYLACMIILLASVSSRAQLKGELLNGAEVVSNEVLVKFNHSTHLTGALLEQAEARSLAEIAGTSDIDESRLIGGIPVHRLHSRSRNVAELIQQIRSRSDVEYVEPNFVIRINRTPNDPSFSSLYGLQKISAPSAWEKNIGNASVTLGVIDSGIDYTHPDLVGNVWSAPALFLVRIGGVNITCPAGTHGFNAIVNSCDPFDDNGHGTHVSGTIGATGNNGVGVVGVNWTTSIMASKFLDSTGAGSTTGAINAIEFVVQANMASQSPNVRVLSNSWGGGPFSQALLDEINRAGGNNMLFVAAAGNSGTNNDTTPEYPASFNTQYVIAVAATDSNDQLASFSNFGHTTVHLGAPGVGILSTFPGATYQFLDGTSMATPHVSGAAALILSACNLDTLTLKSTILNTVDPDSALVGKTITGGRLNVNRALRSCLSPLKSYTLSSANAEVASLDTNQHVRQFAWNGSTWANQDLTANAGTGTPLAAADSGLSSFSLNSSNANINYVGANQHVYQLAWPGPPSNWISQDLTSMSGGFTNLAAPGTSLFSYSLGSLNAEVVYLGTDQHVKQLAWNNSPWVSQDLSASAGASTPLAMAGSALTAYSVGPSNVQVVYEGTNQHVYQLAWACCSPWVSQDLSNFSGTLAPLAAPGSALTSYSLGSNNAQVVYLGADQHVYQLVWIPGSTWVSQDLTNFSGTLAPLAAPGSSLANYSVGPNNAQVVYLGTNQHVYQLVWIPGSTWISQDLTALSSGPPAASGSALSTYTLGNNNAEVVFMGANHHIYQLLWNGSTWISQDLTVLAP
jgi:subtilisin family serine protease